MNIQQVFSEDFIQQSLLGDPLPRPPDQSRPSSSSSSLRSLSMGSPPEFSSFKGSAASSSFMPPEAYARLPFPTPAADDAAMAQAMLTVISSSTPPSLLYQRPQRDVQAPRQRAFEAYNAALRPKTDPVKPGVPGQKMIKMAVSMLRRVHMMRFEARMPEQRPTSNQLHHMISERRRREKINESFHALRMLLPPGSKVHIYGISIDHTHKKITGLLILT